MEEDDEYYENLSEAAFACLSFFAEDPYFYNDDPYDFINASDVAEHVYSILKNFELDFRELMNESEQAEYNKINR